MNVVRCPKCQHPQPFEALDDGAPSPCPQCKVELRISTFPAVQRTPVPGAIAEKARLEGETTCFFHPEKKAAVVCDSCGRLVCTLCDVLIAGRHLCPRCIEAGREKKTLTVLETRRTVYPRLALNLAFLPLLLYPVTFITAPLTIFFVFYGWNKPPSLTSGRQRTLLIVALLFALTQCGAWIFGFTVLYETLRHG